ncbi:MAG: hypothetical protein Pg6C_07750 [Treponemataceae bacterium]|nr:MAG: hypothetical protein Pg6C_07750 [Treponemataceae bacterium]
MSFEYRANAPPIPYSAAHSSNSDVISSGVEPPLCIFPRFSFCQNRTSHIPSALQRGWLIASVQHSITES